MISLFPKNKPFLPVPIRVSRGASERAKWKGTGVDTSARDPNATMNEDDASTLAFIIAERAPPVALICSNVPLILGCVYEVLGDIRIGVAEIGTPHVPELLRRVRDAAERMSQQWYYQLGYLWEQEMYVVPAERLLKASLCLNRGTI